MCRTGHYWYIYGGNDYTQFDFEYTPVPWENDHLHVWPSQWQRTGGVYLANQHTVHHREYNFHIDQCVTRIANKSLWTVPANIDDSDFDYSWHPDETEPSYLYQFGTQWQRDGGPVYPGTAGIKFMASQRIKANATQIFYIDFLNPESQEQFKQLQTQYPDIKITRYVDNHLNVFKRIMNLATTEFVWIVSSVCDYTIGFDFTWHPDDAQREMIHCFPSGSQKRGDTFYIHVPSFTQQMVELELLDWFNVINYCDEQSMARFPMPVHQFETDDLVSEIKKYKFKTPYVVFTNHPKLNWLTFQTVDTVDVIDIPCLWSKKDRTVIRASASGATVLIPRDIKEDLRTQIYDYPHIMTAKHQVNDYFIHNKLPGLDIVYISNGEPDEEKWYNHTCKVTNSTVKWIRGINGRTAAYQAAARASETPWFFAVFAKLEVLGNQFPWTTWVPDYFQEPKHYIFNSLNPLNGLIYGHQGVIAYNTRLVLENNNPGIDFTLSQPHESVPILSGIANFNQDQWMTWRTACREVVKLKHFMVTEPTLETEHRLNVWLDPNYLKPVEFAEWSVRGAKDAVEYYNSVNGDYKKLLKTFEWDWLKSYYNSQYNK